jgi:hypothetical protein
VVWQKTVEIDSRIPSELRRVSHADVERGACTPDLMLLNSITDSRCVLRPARPNRNAY